MVGSKELLFICPVIYEEKFNRRVIKTSNGKRVAYQSKDWEYENEKRMIFIQCLMPLVI